MILLPNYLDSAIIRLFLQLQVCLQIAIRFDGCLFWLYVFCFISETCSRGSIIWFCFLQSEEGSPSSFDLFGFDLDLSRVTFVDHWSHWLGKKPLESLLLRQFWGTTDCFLRGFNNNWRSSLNLIFLVTGLIQLCFLITDRNLNFNVFLGLCGLLFFRWLVRFTILLRQLQVLLAPYFWAHQLDSVALLLPVLWQQSRPRM